MTKPARPNLRLLAEALLEGLANGSPESVQAAELLAEAVLHQPLVRRAIQLEELLRDGSPLALVRAVELAEELIGLSRDRRKAL